MLFLEKNRLGLKPNLGNPGSATGYFHGTRCLIRIIAIDGRTIRDALLDKGMKHSFQFQFQFVRLSCLSKGDDEYALQTTAMCPSLLLV